MMVIFEKGKALRHIGHLDLMRTVQRALRRSGLPIAYSKGFSPHVQLSFAAPLSVGVVGLREVMDVPIESAMDEPEFAAQLNAALPVCLQVRRARLLPDSFPTLMALVAASRYTLYLEAGEATEKVLAKLPEFLSLDTYTALRKTKSGEALCNIRPFVVEAAAVLGKEAPTLTCVLEATPAGTLKPSLFVQCLCEMAGIFQLPMLAVREDILCRDPAGALISMEDYAHA